MDESNTPPDLPILAPNAQAGLDTTSIRSDPKLIADGWVRRHLVDPDRADESVELYGSLGFEVLAHSLTPADFGPNCQTCASVICKTYVLIYTRKKSQ